MAEPSYNTGGYYDVGTGDSDSRAIDLGSASGDRTLVVVISTYDDDQSCLPSAVTIGGNAMSLGSSDAQVSYIFGSRYVETSIYKYDNAPTGSNTLAITLAGDADQYFEVCWAVYTDANNGFTSAYANTSGNILDHEYDITGTEADGMHIQAGASNDRWYIAGTGTTLRQGGGEVNFGAGSWLAEEPSSGGTDTVGGALNANSRSASVIVEMAPSAAGGEDFTVPIMMYHQMYSRG